jgi:putative salt-induced outer membrane protein YdiY
MKFVCALTSALIITASSACADSLTLKNGDHLTGAIESADGKQVTFKTDYAGEIKVNWSAIQTVATQNPLYVVTPEKKTVMGPLSMEAAGLVVHTMTGDVHVPLSDTTVVRSQAGETAYEHSLHPGLLEAWKVAGSLGYDIARGNSDSTNLTYGANADRKTISDELKLSASTIYATSVTKGVSTVTANETLGDARFDHNITAPLFAFISGDFTHDTLQGLNLRQIYTGGLGWHAIAKPSTTFDVFGGVNYTRESYSSGTTGTAAPGVQVNRNLPGLTAGEDFTHKFGAAGVFTEEFDFYPDLYDISQYRFSLNSAFNAKIYKWFGWQVTLNDRYVTDPPIAGTKSNDFVLSTGLTAAFTH